MPWEWSRSFGFKLMLLTTLASGVAVVVVSGTFRVIEILDVKPATLAAVATHTAVIATNSTAAVTFGDKKAATETLLALRDVPNVLAGAIYDTDGNLFAEYRRSPNVSITPPTAPLVGEVFQGQELNFTRDIIYENERLGRLLLIYDLTDKYARVLRNAGLAVVIGLVAMLSSFLMAIRLNRVLARPIDELASTARRVSQTENYSLRAIQYGEDELGQLTQAFNQMLDRIQVRDVQLKEAQEAQSHSEERARKIVDTALDAVVTMDSESRVTGWNTQAERTFGWAATEAIGQCFVDLIIPPQHRESHNNGVAKFFETGDGLILGQRIVTTAMRRGGQEFPIELAITPINLEGRTSFSAFVRDITERKQAEERFRQVVESAPNGLVMVDANGVIVLANAQAESIFACDRKELLGQSIDSLLPERFRTEDHGFGKNFQASARARSLGVESDLFGLRKDGTEFPMEVGLNPFEFDEEFFVLASIVDITERKRSETILRDREARFRAVVETASDGIVTINQSGIIEFTNPAVERMFGYAHDELIGQNVRLLMPEPDKSKHNEYLSNYMRTGEAKIIGIGREVQAQRKDGTLFPMNLSIGQFELGGQRYFTAVVSDLTRRKQAEDALARERQLLRTLIDNAPDCIYVKDKECRFELSNPAHMAVLGITAGDTAVGKSDAAFFPKHMADRYRADDQLILNTGKPLLNREEPVVEPDGRVRWFATSKIPVHDVDGRIVRLVGISRDITDLRDAREKLEVTNTELRQKNQEMEQFVYTVSHDLKSPIVTCVGFLGMMKEDLEAGQTDQLSDSMKRLERAVGRMQKSIDDLLELSRVGRIRNEPEEINMDQLMAMISEELTPRLQDKGFTLEVEPNLPPIIADRMRVTEVFENLIGNALKYASDVPNPRVTVGAEAVDEEVRFFVADNGPGIAKEYHQRIFGLFQRLDNTKDGTGVGLTIVARIMEVHGGRVWLESDAGQGAKFWVAFPLAVADSIVVKPPV